MRRSCTSSVGGTDDTLSACSVPLLPSREGREPGGESKPRNDSKEGDAAVKTRTTLPQPRFSGQRTGMSSAHASRLSEKSDGLLKSILLMTRVAFESKGRY